MEIRNYDYGTQGSYALPETFAKVMRNVYAWMSCGLAMTALTAMYVAGNLSIIEAIATNRLLMWLLFGSEIGLVIWLSSSINKISSMTAGLIFAAYAVLNGVTMSFIFLAYTMESIATTFFTTAGTFAAMSVIGYVTKKDLSGLGRILTMLLIGLIIATVVNIFVGNSGFALILNYVGVAIFVGLTAYDTQKIKQMVEQSCMYGDDDQTTKLALLGSLTLYLDFINLFLHLLRLFGNRK